jgi:hypothetical protein
MTPNRVVATRWAGAGADEFAPTLAELVRPSNRVAGDAAARTGWKLSEVVLRGRAAAEIGIAATGRGPLGRVGGGGRSRRVSWGRTRPAANEGALAVVVGTRSRIGSFPDRGASRAAIAMGTKTGIPAFMRSIRPRL